MSQHGHYDQHPGPETEFHHSDHHDLTYPGTSPDFEEGLGTSNSPGSDNRGPRTITIAHYVHQYGASGHYNPIIQKDKEDCSVEETDIVEVVDDEESPDPGSNAYGKDGEDGMSLATSSTMDTEESESPDRTVSNGSKAKTDSKGLDLCWDVRPMVLRTKQTTVMP